MMKVSFKKILPWIILLVIIASLGVWYFLSKRITQDQLSAYNSTLTEANTYLEARQYSVAIEKYQDASEIVPSKVEAYDGIVTILLLKNRVNDALEIVDKSAKSLNLNNKAILYSSIGDYYYQLKDYEKAKEIYQNALGIGVSNMDVEFMLGKALLNVGKIKEARSQFEKEDYAEDTQSEANLLLSYIIASEDRELAKTKMASVSPTQKFFPYYEEFIEILNSLDDDSKYNATKLARIYINNGYPYLAVSVLQPLEKDILEYVDGLYFLGRGYLETKNYEKSIEILDKAVSLGGLESEIFGYKGRAYFLQNDLDNSFKSYQRAIDYAGTAASQNLVEEYVGILLENKQTLKAEDLVRNLLLKKGDPYLLFLGLKIEYELKDEKKVDYYISQLAKKDLVEEEKMEYIYWQVKVMLDRNKDNGISELLDQLLAFSKYNPKYYLLKGRYDLSLSNMDGAKSALENVLEYDLNGTVTPEASGLLSNIK
ncbi:MAG: tetratricopeptide repeat protein [Candidatus Dojkabacteria bacterium]